MASSGKPNNKDSPMRNADDSDGTDEDNETEVPIHGNEGKRKAKNGGEGSSFNSKRRTTSWVWDHFTRHKDDQDTANCNHCGKSMTVPSKSGTSNMRRHLEIACKAFQLWEAANKYKDQTELGTDGDNSSLRYYKVSDDVIREATNEMLVLGELPLAFIDSLAWRHFCSRVKFCKPKCRRTATRDIVEMYVKRKAAMKKTLGQNKQRMSLTTDIWVAPHTGASYMVITAHFVDAWWKLRKLIIGFKNIYDHKASTISKVLVDCLVEWDIKKVFCITVDNATANSSALKTFKEEFNKVGDDAMVLKGQFLHLRCATHIINLIVKEGLEEIDDSVAAIRNGIQFLRSSTNRFKSFEARVESGRIQRGSLPLDVSTRWNSTYLMLEQAMKFRIAFEKMEVEDKPYYDYFTEKVGKENKKRIGPPNRNDWAAVERLVKFLIIFYKSTLTLSASTSVRSHKLYNEIVSIYRNVRALSSSSGLDKELQSKANAMLGKLGKYWDAFGEEVEMNRLLIVATVFDPCKKMKFAQLCFDKLYGKDSVEATHLADSINGILKDLYDEYSAVVNKNDVGESASSSQRYGASSEFRNASSSRQDIDNGAQLEDMLDVYNELVQESGIPEKTNELDLYLKEGVENPNLMQGTEYDVLSWWRTNSPRFPVLSLIARDILAMQVSSVASESAFNTSGRILDPYRSCLTPYMLEVLMCTEQWFKCEIKIDEKGVVVRQEQILSEIELQDDLMREFEPEFNFQGSC